MVLVADRPVMMAQHRRPEDGKRGFDVWWKVSGPKRDHSYFIRPVAGGSFPQHPALIPPPRREPRSAPALRFHLMVPQVATKRVPDYAPFPLRARR